MMYNWKNAMQVREAEKKSRRELHECLVTSDREEDALIYKRANQLVLDVLENVKNPDVKFIQLLFQVKEKGLLGFPLVSVCVSTGHGAMSKYIFNNCTYLQVFKLLKEQLKENGVPVENANCHDGLIIEVE